MGLNILDVSALEPSNYTDNHYFETQIDTSDEWIKKRTGIFKRHLSEIPLKEMVENTVKKLDIKEKKKKIKMILVATISSEMIIPSLASYVHRALNLSEDVFSIDLNMACSGFAAALTLAEARLNIGECAVVVGAEKLSDYTDFKDRQTSFLFGDGVGAVLVEKNGKEFLYKSGTIFSEDLYLKKDQKIQMNGRKIYEFAIGILPKIIYSMLPNGLEDIDQVVIHQANERILERVGKSLNASDKFFSNIKSTGNTSSASIPIALNDLKKCSKLKRDDEILIIGFGGGLSYSALVLEWGF